MPGGVHQVAEIQGFRNWKRATSFEKKSNWRPKKRQLGRRISQNGRRNPPLASG